MAFVSCDVRSSVPPSLQANRMLLLLAMKEAEKSVAEFRKSSGTVTYSLIFLYFDTITFEIQLHVMRGDCLLLILNVKRSYEWQPQGLLRACLCVCLCVCWLSSEFFCC